MYYFYRQPEEHGAYVTGLHSEFPMSLKQSYLLVSIRERVAGNLLREAESGKSKPGKRAPDIQKATVLHEVRQQELSAFVEATPPSPKTELQVLRILDGYLSLVIDK